MLPKNRRISRKEFQHILTIGKRYNSPHLMLQVLKLSQENMAKNSQFSFSVSKKVCKNASDRNKYRRRGYSIIKDNLSKIKNGFYCLFSFKKGSVPISFIDLNKEIMGLLSSASVLS